MPQMKFIHIGRPMRPVDWVIVFLILALIAGVAIAIVVVALGIFLILAPVLAVVGLAYYFLWRMRLRAAMRKWRNAANIVEGEYRVVDPREPKSNERATLTKSRSMVRTPVMVLTRIGNTLERKMIAILAQMSMPNQMMISGISAMRGIA